MKLRRLVLLTGMLAAGACHPGPVINTGGNTVGGTIAGIVTTDGKVAVPTRRVTVINTMTGEKFETTTATNGGYTIKVPQGTYRLEVELREGEKSRQAAWRDESAEFGPRSAAPLRDYGRSPRRSLIRAPQS